MNKTFLFLVSIILLLTSCSNDDKYDDHDTSLASKQIRWYGMQLPQETQTRGVANGSKLWDQKASITVKFLNLPSDRSLIDSVKQIAAEWEQYANIHFDFVRGDMDADVRIAFDWMGNNWLTWSYTGTDAKSITNQRVPTAVFAGLDNLSPKERKGDILRLFGQILGLEYEQRHQQWAENGSWKDENELQAYWEGLFYHYYQMKWDEIKEYVFTPMTQNSTSSLYASKDIDKQSVMAWPYYTSGQANVLVANYELSAGDKAFIAQLYPKDKQSLPTIQEAWVDAGYFEWTSASKNQLRMTELGFEQEYLPDVCDGEQLTNGYRLFCYIDVNEILIEVGSKLKKAPLFNTSNITNFYKMFYNCSYLTSVRQLDTSKGTNLSAMFSGCSSLTSIPELDTSKGTDFSSMFSGCSSLTSIPQLDTSKGTDFSFMFYHCKILASIPHLDTSSGINFRDMFWHCNALAFIPHFDTSNGENFNGMFFGCYNLTTIPHIETSKGIDFTAMFRYCYKLTSIPKLNTSNGTSFVQMFYRCSSLTTIPYLDTSKGTNFSSMFNDCTSLTSIPEIETSKGTDFSRMFFGCESLTSIPEIDTSKGTDFSWMFFGCKSLTSIPEIDTSKGTDFSWMFSGCKSLTSIPEIDTSEGTDFSLMFGACHSLKTIPRLNTSKGIKFGHYDSSNVYFSNGNGMFAQCTALEFIPDLDTSNGTDFGGMFQGCKSLKQKPNLNLSKATNTFNMYYGTPFANDPL